MNSKLTAKQEAFAVAMCDPSCKGPSEAYKRAGYRVDDPPTKAQMTAASELTAHPMVAGRIKELRAASSDFVMMQAADVLREWFTIATADPAELIRTRRFCCRHCYGLNHNYQWISDEEFAIACARVIDWNVAKPTRSAAKAMPSYDGGVGYDRNNKPVATCPHCGGDGFEDVYVEATERLSPAARKLYAGVEVKANGGLKILMRDQDGALGNIAKYLGMLADRHMHGGDPNNPTPITSLTADMDAATAAKAYAAAMGAYGK